MRRGILTFLLSTCLTVIGLGQAVGNGAKVFSIPIAMSADKNGDAPTLSLTDLEISESGKRVSILSLESSNGPLTIGFLIDLSASGASGPNKNKIGRHLNNALAELEKFVELGQSQNEYFLTVVHKGTFNITPLTKNHELIKSAIQELAVEEPKGNTPYYDALAASISNIISVGNYRKVMVVISDGADTSSKKTDFGDLLRLTQGENLSIYGVNFNSDSMSSYGLQGEAFLIQLCEVSGGRCLSLNDKADWVNWSQTIGRELGTNYVATIQLDPTKGKPKWRKFKVELSDAAQTRLGKREIRARKGIVF